MGASKNLQRMARVGILDPNDLSAGRQGRPEVRILVSDAPKRSGNGARRSERSIRLRGNEGWVKKSHAPDRRFGVARRVDLPYGGPMPPKGGFSRHPDMSFTISFNALSGPFNTSASPETSSL